MLNRGVLSLVIVTLALLACPDLAAPVIAADILVVDDSGPPYCGPVMTAYPTITAALAAANPEDTIYVCDGVYWEPFMHITKKLTIIGPGAPSRGDGVATVHYMGGTGWELFAIDADDVVIQGLDLDATGGIGITSFGNRVEISHNEIRNASDTAIQTYYSGTHNNVRILSNYIHDSQQGVKLGYPNNPCDDCVVSGNTVNVTGSATNQYAIELEGSNGNITSNVVDGRVGGSGDNLFVANNQISGVTTTTDPLNGLLSVGGNFVGVTENRLSDADYGLVVGVAPSGGSITIQLNTFTRMANPIGLVSWGVGNLAATIGGSESYANTFVDSGGSLGDSNYLLKLVDIQTNINAEYNNWGLCSADEIEQEIYHQVDDPTEGLVDFDPFIAPASCSATPTPTPSPTPTATATATPTPGPTRAVTIPAGSWANFAWSGDSTPQTVADCFGAGNVAVMYRLDSAIGTFQRWIRGRDDLSNMTDVFRYEALLALNASAQPATCTMPNVLLARSLTIPGGSWANFAWTGGATLSAEAVAQCFGEGNMAVMYRLDALTQTFERWIRARPDLSNMTDVQPFDALLALNGSDQPATCTFPVLAASGLPEPG